MRYPWLLAFKESKKLSTLGVLCGGVYCYLSYHEIFYLKNFATNSRIIHQVFSDFSIRANTTICGTYSIEDETLLLDSVSKARWAVLESFTLRLVKPIMIAAIRLILNHSLVYYLKRRWLQENKNSQIGLKIFNPQMANQARDIMVDHTWHYAIGLTNHISLFIDALVVLSNLYHIYEQSNKFNSEESSNFTSFTFNMFTVYLAITLMANSFLKKLIYSTSNIRSAFRQSLSYNSDYAFQVETSRTSLRESTSLGNRLAVLSYQSFAREILENLIQNAGIVLNTVLETELLNYFAPSILRKPQLYYALYDVLGLVGHFSMNLSSTITKYSKTADSAFACTKIVQFVNAIDQYAKLVSNNDHFIVQVKPYSPLTVDLKIINPHSKKTEVLSRIRKTFEPGKMYAISGKSGAGKTSFFKAILGMSIYAQGSVTVPREDNIIYLSQSFILRPGLSWLDTLYYPLDKKERNSLSLQGIDEINNEIHTYIEKLNLQKILTKAMENPSNWTIGISDGERQRVNFLHALVSVAICRIKSPTEKAALLLDEAINALDQQMQSEAFDILRSVLKKNKDTLTILSIDHSPQPMLKRNYSEKNIIRFGGHTEISARTP